MRRKSRAAKFFSLKPNWKRSETKHVSWGGAAAHILTKSLAFDVGPPPSPNNHGWAVGWVGGGLGGVGKATTSTETCLVLNHLQSI